MNKKQLQTDDIANELKGASLYFAKTAINTPNSKSHSAPMRERKTEQMKTLKVTSERDSSRSPSSDNPREIPRDLPTRDEIQEFSFRLRDELKVKVQAEVPHGWQEELEESARKLKVKKLELYRFILGEFLGKTKRKEGT